MSVKGSWSRIKDHKRAGETIERVYGKKKLNIMSDEDRKKMKGEVSEEKSRKGIVESVFRGEEAEKRCIDS